VRVNVRKATGTVENVRDFNDETSPKMTIKCDNRCCDVTTNTKCHDEGGRWKFTRYREKILHV